jgi:hypothetical protein
MIPPPEEGRIGVVRGFIKKTRKTPAEELALADKRMKDQLSTVTIVEIHTRGGTGEMTKAGFAESHLASSLFPYTRQAIRQKARYALHDAASSVDLMLHSFFKFPIYELAHSSTLLPEFSNVGRRKTRHIARTGGRFSDHLEVILAYIDRRPDPTQSTAHPRLDIPQQHLEMRNTATAQYYRPTKSEGPQ